MTTLICALLCQPGRQGEFVQKLPSGPNLSLVAVTGGGHSWSPSGGTPPLRSYMKDVHLSPNPVAFVVEFEHKAAQDYPRIAFQFPKGKVYASALVMKNTKDAERAHKPALWYAIGSAGPNREGATTDVRVGYAYGHWRALDTIVVREGKVRPHSGIATVTGLGSSSPQGQKAMGVRFKITLSKDLSPNASRIVAFDKKGKLLEMRGWSTTPGGVQECYFGGSPASLARIEVQTQPYVWTTFKNVKIKP